VEVWLRFDSVWLILAQFRRGSGLAQIWLRFGSGLVQFGSGFVQIGAGVVQVRLLGSLAKVFGSRVWVWLRLNLTQV